MLNRRALVAAAITSPIYLKEGFAQAPEVTLKLHHMLAPVSMAHQKFLAPWAKIVEEASGGRLKINLFPAMQLGGAPPQLFDQAKDGVVDMIWTVPGYTAGRFPVMETIELPFVANKRAIVNSKAFQEFGDKHLKTELKDVRPICVWTHDHGLIHSSKPIKTMADINGLKLRFPTRLAGEALRAVGANAIGMPVPQVPESLANGVIDGAVVPWEIVPALKIHELVKNHTEFLGSPTFYVASFLFAMNNGAFDKLSNESKEVITKHSGQFAAQMAAKAWDETAASVSDMISKRAGNTIHQIDATEAAKWQATTKPIHENWFKGMKEKGMDGEKLLGELQDLLKKHA